VGRSRSSASPTKDKLRPHQRKCSARGKGGDLAARRYRLSPRETDRRERSSGGKIPSGGARAREAARRRARWTRPAKGRASDGHGAARPKPADCQEKDPGRVRDLASSRGATIPPAASAKQGAPQVSRPILPLRGQDLKTSRRATLTRSWRLSERRPINPLPLISTRWPPASASEDFNADKLPLSPHHHHEPDAGRVRRPHPHALLLRRSSTARSGCWWKRGARPDI